MGFLMTPIVTLLIGIFAGAGIFGLIIIIRNNYIENKANKYLKEVKEEALQHKRDTLLELKEESYRLKQEAEKEIKEKKQELSISEDKLMQRESSLDRREEMLQNRDSMLDQKDNNLLAKQKELQEKEKKILIDRFFMGKTQVEISEEIGISQAQVSRLEKNAISNIKKFIK